MAEFCGSCGTRAVGGDQFCRSCGASLAPTGEWPAGGDLDAIATTETALAAQPQVAAVPERTAVTAPVPPVLPLPPSRATRPAWLIPAAIAVLAVLVAAGLAFVLLGGGSGSPGGSLAQSTAPQAAVIRSDSARLARAIAAVGSSREFGSVMTAANELGDELGRTRSEIGVLDGEQAQLARLDALLAARGSYASAVAAAAASPSPRSFADADAARADAMQAQTKLTATDKELGAAWAAPLPALTTLRRVDAKEQAAAAKAKADKATKAHAARASATAAARAYARQIDALLRNSAETRSDLGALIAGIQNGTIAAYEARTQIDAILNQRQDLQNAVAAVAAPAALQHAATLLRDSIGAAIDDDQAIQGWINAWYVDDVATFNRYWAEHLDATAAATRAKEAFAAEYSEARARLGLTRYTGGTGY
jgi:hypothetical protein